MKTAFIERVMQIMNETGWNDTASDSFIGSDTTHVKEHIERVFVDAWRKAVDVLPKTYFTIKDFSGSRHYSDITDGTGYVVLPEDFYKLSSFKMKGWQTTVETLLNNVDPLAKVQANEYTRGNICRPVCVLNNRPIKKRQGDEMVYVPENVLEYYSLPNGYRHQVEEALYIPMTEPLSDATTLNGKLYAPLAYLCASQVFHIFEKTDIAQVLESKAIEISN